MNGDRNRRYKTEDEVTHDYGIPVEALRTLRALGVGPRHVYSSRLGYVYAGPDFSNWLLR